VGGGTPSTKRAEFFDGDIPWLTPKDLSGYGQRYISRGARNITEAGLRSSGAKLMPKGTVLLTSRAPVGYVAIAQNPITTNQGFKSLIPKGGFDSEFLYYLLKSNTEHLKSHASGTTFAELSGGVLKQIRFTVPSHNTQREIAGILGSLDDKIELNRQMNKTLEAMSRALFQCWFMDFEPVRMKAEGKDPSAPVSKGGLGLDPAIAMLFPDSLDDSLLGEIPKGWRVEPLHQHYDAVRGLSYTGSGLSNDGLPLHNLNSVLEGGGYKYAGIKHYIGEYRERHLVHPGDVLVANTEQGFGYLLIGYPAIVPHRFGDVGLFSHHLYRIRTKPTSYLTNYFIYLALIADHKFRDVVIGYTNGTTVNMLSIDGLQAPHIIVPPQELINLLISSVSPQLALSESIVNETEQLSLLRDTLLQPLVDGTIQLGREV
jgi:type I restriction enzyme S subunit